MSREMIKTFLLYLLTTTVALVILFAIVTVILRAIQPVSATLHKLAWGGVLVVSLLALVIPLRLPVYEAGAEK